MTAILCSVCGNGYDEWFEDCPNCADKRRRQHPRNHSEIMINVAEERQCPVCQRRNALKIEKLTQLHIQRRACRYCGYKDTVGYLPNEAREW